MNQIDIARAAGRLRSADAVWILAHSHPDGDALGCAFAMAHALKAMGKVVGVFCEDPVPAMFSYMREGLEDQVYIGGAAPSLQPPDTCLLATDLAVEHLLGPALCERFRGKIDLSIDHHPANAFFAKETLLDVTAAAAAEIISDVIDELGVPMTILIAACLYAGISTDTGCFRYPSTTARSHRYAARYMDLGVRTEPLDRAFFETETRTYMALERMTFDGLRYYCGGRVALVAVTQAMFEKSGSNDEEYIKIVARTRNIEGVQVGVSIRERPDGTFKISLRSHDAIDSAAICAKMGGGGHKYAAACVSERPLEKTIAEIILYIEEAFGEVAGA